MAIPDLTKVHALLALIKTHQAAKPNRIFMDIPARPCRCDAD